MIQAINFGNPVNWQSPLSRSLRLWWLSLPRNTGNQVVDLCQTANGTLTNGVTYSGFRPGGFGPTWKCDGTDDYIGEATVFNRYIAVTSELTVSFWFNPGSAWSSYENVFEAANDTGDVARMLSIFINSGSDGYRGIGSSGGPLSFSPEWTLAEWQHMTITDAASTLKVYRNGIECASVGHVAPSYTGTIETRMGANRSGGATFSDSAYDDLRIYDRPLSASEVRNLYEASRTGYQLELNRLSKRFMLSTPPAASGNRRRRILIAG